MLRELEKLRDSAVLDKSTRDKLELKLNSIPSLEREIGERQANLEPILAMASLWRMTVPIWAVLAAAALVLSWTIYLDRQSRYFAQKGWWVVTSGYLLTMLVLWGVVVGGWGMLATEVWNTPTMNQGQDAVVDILLLFGAAGLIAAIWVEQGSRAYFEIKYASARLYGACRGVTAFMVLTAELVAVANVIWSFV